MFFKAFRKWLNQFSSWVVRTVTGRSWFVSRDNENTDADRTCFVIGFRTRDGKIYVIDRHYETNWAMQSETLRKGFFGNKYSPQQVEQAMKDIKKSLLTKRQLIQKAKDKNDAKNN